MYNVKWAVSKDGKSASGNRCFLNKIEMLLIVMSITVKGNIKGEIITIEIEED